MNFVPASTLRSLSVPCSRPEQWWIPPESIAPAPGRNPHECWRCWGDEFSVDQGRVFRKIFLQKHNGHSNRNCWLLYWLYRTISLVGGFNPSEKYQSVGMTASSGPSEPSHWQLHSTMASTAQPCPHQMVQRDQNLGSAATCSHYADPFYNKWVEQNTMIVETNVRRLKHIAFCW